MGGRRLWTAVGVMAGLMLAGASSRSEEFQLPDEHSAIPQRECEARMQADGSPNPLRPRATTSNHDCDGAPVADCY